MSIRRALPWAALGDLASAHYTVPDVINGPTNPHAHLRLFGKSESDVRVTLFRDKHQWCPYCQKVWLWMEEKRIPYRVQKVTMFCYGEKEPWYLKIVPRGMLPALDLDGLVITESDDILAALEREFGPLAGKAMSDPDVVPMRRLERQLFRAWCNWLCYPASSTAEERRARTMFESVAQDVEHALGVHEGPFMLETFSVADVVLTPYVERMNASLYYYKGYSLREANPRLGAWFDAMELRETYRGTQSDFHTHVHDLPPQMGGCHRTKGGSAEQRAYEEHVTNGPRWDDLPDARFPEPESSKMEAVHRVVKFHKQMLATANATVAGGGQGELESADEALRCALTLLATGELVRPPPGTDATLRYWRDRVNVPRDMSIWAGRRLREALERTAATVGAAQGPPIPYKHRRDQNPVPFETRSSS